MSKIATKLIAMQLTCCFCGCFDVHAALVEWDCMIKYIAAFVATTDAHKFRIFAFALHCFLKKRNLCQYDILPHQCDESGTFAICCCAFSCHCNGSCIRKSHCVPVHIYMKCILCLMQVYSDAARFSTGLYRCNLHMCRYVPGFALSTSQP